MASEGAPIESKEWTLDPETEYRFELDPGTSLAIKLIRGHAEVFGAELAANKPYLFGSECKAAIFTWRGCTIEVTGHPSTEYVSEETPMAAYANLHIAFEQMRVRALRDLRGSPVPDYERDKPTDPPRVLVLGPENSGKTTICKLLINYAVRAGQGWSPLLINTDPAEGGWAAPGALSVAPVHSPLLTCSPASPLGAAATSAPPTALSSNALLPLAYWYGHTEAKRNPLLVERVIRNIGENINDKYQVDLEGRTAGLIVDTPSSFASGSGSSDERQRLIKACVDAFKINVILVVGHEKLNVEMQRTFAKQLTVVKIPKSGGVVELDHLYRERVHKYQLHTYFYGQIIPPTLRHLLRPARRRNSLRPRPVPVLHQTMAPSSALPIGAARAVSETQAVAIDPAMPGSGLLNAVLAVLAPPVNTDESERYDEEILDLPISGFIVITNLDIPHRKMTVLTPNQGSVVGRTAVIGSFEWSE
ncbi:mRNA cleavage and polyadenylation factor CLP1 [Mycena sanguinolenta]|uniref:Polynucleotide 5'-hydroxyl-kinase GRC3 n=1 Tax=Mycena sanguinolenta TaxID=230812 RepID=A0A8H7D8T0_9AGAR|nr:mRNA cleavage and polyadenylation factor CLP1 [Mycena sanguinolenta]